MLVWLVLITTVWNIVRLATAWSWRNNLDNYAPYPGSLYIALTGFFWALVGLLALSSLWRGAQRTRLFLSILISAYAAWVWTDILFVQNNLRANWPYDLLITVLLLGFATFVLWDPRNESYFRKETHER
jgi:hypothetical protein